MSDLSLPCHFEADVLLSTRAYYGIGGTTRFFACPESVAELVELLLWNRIHRLPVAVMGSGSNIIFSDEPFPGIVISLERMRRMFWISDDELFCEAGVDNTVISEELLRFSRGGGEWLFRLPGQIGSTVRMNARCFGGEVSAITAGIVTVDIDGRLQWQLPDDVFYGYKHTSLMDNREIVVAVVLRFPQVRSSEEINLLMREYEDERIRKHHFDFPSCGSTFKNNYAAGCSSGRIFEQLGFKGELEGGAMVSEHHANFIYNRGGATAADVLRLAARMRAAALDRSGVELDLEVQCIGLFDVDLLASCGAGYVADCHDPSKGWAGVLWFPENERRKNSVPVFPCRLLQGPLIGYSGQKGEFPATVFVEVEQLLSLQDGVANPVAPFLRWTTRCDDPNLFAVKPPASIPAGAFTDGLWLYGVSELFIGDGAAGSGYLEFEMTPDGHWVALRFDQPRHRAKNFTVLSPEPWNTSASVVHDEAGFGMEFSYELLRPFIAGQIIALQCCASTGREAYGVYPWWYLPPLPADFHQPDRFCQVYLS
ncbi:MAG: UDP-N-acetylmuramate dehydrogenase [Chlorobiaceae bacterium]